MALIKCYECGSEISNTASLCPQCGSPRKPVGWVEAQRKILDSLSFGVTVVLSIIFISGGLYMISVNCEDNSAKFCVGLPGQLDDFRSSIGVFFLILGVFGVLFEMFSDVIRKN